MCTGNTASGYNHVCEAQGTILKSDAADIAQGDNPESNCCTAVCA